MPGDNSDHINHKFEQTESEKARKCVCLPINHTVLITAVKIPAIWSELRANCHLCDGTIRCGGNVFPIHRVILSAISPYFRVLFINRLQGSTGNTTEVSLNHVSGDIFSLILDYAYTGICKVTIDNVEQLLPLADQFEVLGVVQLCCQFLFDELRPENCIGILKFARHYFCHDLEAKGRKYICHNFKKILRNSLEFKELTCDELYEVLHDDELNVRNEEIVFEAIKTWVERRENGDNDEDYKDRKNNLPKLLECVRFGLINSQYLITNILAWDLIKESEDCKKIAQPTGTQLEALSQPRIPYEILFAIGGWSGGSPTNFVETYDTRADRWFLSINTDVTPRAYHGVCALNNLIYIIGGYDGFENFNTVRCFNPITKEWCEKACMYHARCYVSVCVHGGKIYALGGSNGRTRLSSAERYEPERNQWEMIAPMNRHRSDASAAALNDKIYIVGGFNGDDIYYSAEVFDVEANQWSYIPSMSYPRTGVSIVAFRGCLYALGGYDGFTRLTSVERYDPNQSEEWQEVTQMFRERSNFTSVVLDDMIFVIGGFNGTTTIAHVECYDPDTNEWYDASPMNLNRSAFCACVISGLNNSREYSYSSKTKNLGQGQASTKLHRNPIERGERYHMSDGETTG